MAKYVIKECELEFVEKDIIHLEAVKKARSLIKLMSKDIELLRILINCTYHYRIDLINPCNKRFKLEIDKQITILSKHRSVLEQFKIEYEDLLVCKSTRFGEVQAFINYSNKVRGNIIELRKLHNS